MLRKLIKFSIISVLSDGGFLRKRSFSIIFVETKTDDLIKRLWNNIF